MSEELETMEIKEPIKFSPKSKIIKATKEIVEEVAVQEVEPIIEEVKQVAPIEHIITINDKQYAVSSKFNISFDEMMSYANANGLEVPNFPELQTIFNQTNDPVKGTYWSTSTFDQYPLRFSYCLTSDGKTIELSTHKIANTFFLKGV